MSEPVSRRPSVSPESFPYINPESLEIRYGSSTLDEFIKSNTALDIVEELAQNTSYLHGDELKRAVEDSASSGKHPNSPYKLGTPPIHPIGGYFMEKTFNPYQLKKDLLNIGFSKCSLYGGVGLSKPKYLRPLISMIPLRYKFMRSHDFKVVAIK